MSAENGNRYAEKWTYEATMKALEKINIFAMMDDTLYLGMALARAGYYDDIWRYWRKKWARNYEIIHEMKMLMQHFEARIYTNTAQRKIPLRLGVFTLQHHYGWGREPQQEDVSYLAEADRAPLPTLSEGEGLTAVPIQTFPQGEGLMQTADANQTAVPIQTFPQGEGLIQAGGDSENSTTADRCSEGEGLMQTADSNQTAVPIQTFPQGEGLMQTAGGDSENSTTADRCSEGEGLMQTADSNQTAVPIQTFPQGEGLIQTAGPIQTFLQGEGLMQTAHLSQPSRKERALMQTADSNQTAVPIQTFPQGEGLMQTAGRSQNPTKEEGSNAEAVRVDEVISEKKNEAAVSATVEKTKRYPIELTPEELEMEVGISDIHEIERRLQEEDPELAEFDDLDEDLEWEVSTPETFKR